MCVQALVCICWSAPGIWWLPSLAPEMARGHIDGSARERCQFRDVPCAGRAAVPLETTLKAGPIVFRAVDLQLLLWEPLTRSNVRGGGHLRSDRLCHFLLEAHDVVGRRWLASSLAVQEASGNSLLRPVRALVVVVGAKKGMHALRAAVHVLVRFPGLSSTTDSACGVGRALQADRRCRWRHGRHRCRGADRLC